MGVWEGEVFVTEAGHRYDSEGRLIAETIPTPAPAPEPEPPKPFTPLVAQVGYTEDENKWIDSAYESLNPKRIREANEYIASKKAEAAVQSVMAAQQISASDPFEATAQKYIRQAYAQYPQADPKQVKDWADMRAVEEIGIQRGDVMGELQRYMARKGGQPAPEKPRDPNTGQFAPPAHPPARTVQPPRAPAPSGSPTARQAVRPSGGDALTKFLKEDMGLSDFAIERAVQETRR
jgi:hypothetical protein